MDSNPALGLIGFWMLLQLIATLALLIGGIYVLFCLGRAASGLDRMANAMEDWITLQNAHAQPLMPQKPGNAFDLSVRVPPVSAAPAQAIPFTPVSPTSQSQTEYSAPDESAR